MKIFTIKGVKAVYELYWFKKLKIQHTPHITYDGKDSVACSYDDLRDLPTLDAKKAIVS